MKKTKKENTVHGWVVLNKGKFNYVSLDEGWIKFVRKILKLEAVSCTITYQIPNKRYVFKK